MDHEVTKADPSNRLAVGINLASGKAYVGVASLTKGLHLDDSCERVELAQRLEGADQLANFHDRIRQEIRRLEPDIVGVLYPRRYGQWKYAEAHTRVSLEAAIMLAAHAESVRYESVKQNDAAKLLEGNVTMLPEAVVAQFELSTTPMYWKDRGPAFAAAHWLVKETVN